jgi:hypothetical protein
VQGKALNTAGKSVFTYKKLVNSIKSPYITGAVIENLNKAYYPSKARKAKRNLYKKNKSSTPNINARNYQNNKEYVPVPTYIPKIGNSAEQTEIDQLRNQRQIDEQDILRRQRENIEELKRLQGHDNHDFSVVHEGNEEIDDVTTIDVDKPEVVKEKSEIDESQPVEPPVEIPSKEEVRQSAVEINESDDEASNGDKDDKDDDENDDENDDDNDGENDDENVDFVRELDDIEISPEKTPDHGKRSKLDKIEELPPNVLAANEHTPIIGAAQKKLKLKQVPKTIKRIFPNVTDVVQWRKRNRLTNKTKIFKMFGNYHSIKKALHERGWVENKDKSSP